MASGSVENPNKERDIEIVKIFQIVDIIIAELGDDKKNAITKKLNAGQIDLDLSDDISGFLMTIYTCLRKSSGDAKGNEKYMNYVSNIDGVNMSVKLIVEKIRAANITLDYMVCTPIIELLTLFKAYYDEVRSGVTKFKVRADVFKRVVKRNRDGTLKREEAKEKMHNITMYGLNNHHVPLLQGITLPPERRTGIIRSIGSLAQCILMTMEDKYYTKLNSALTNSLMMLPMHSEIIQCLKEASSPGAVAGVLKELGDVLLMTTARSTQKIYFPLLLAALMWKAKGATQWSFSGVPMMKFYSEFTTQKGVVYLIKSGSDNSRTAQAIFHAMFGTYLEDLGILEQITNTPKWHHRKDLNTVFTQRSAKAQLKVTPIKFLYISKMAQSLQTKLLGNVEPCATSRPSFTGFRERNFTQEFLAYLTTGKSAINYSSDPMQLQYALKKIKECLMEEKESNKMKISGTSNWVKVGAMEEDEETDFIPKENGKKFYG